MTPYESALEINGIDAPTIEAEVEKTQRENQFNEWIASPLTQKLFAALRTHRDMLHTVAENRLGQTDKVVELTIEAKQTLEIMRYIERIHEQNTIRPGS